MTLKKEAKIFTEHDFYFLRVNFTIAGRVAVLTVASVVECDTSVQLILVLDGVWSLPLSGQLLTVQVGFWW